MRERLLKEMKEWLIRLYEDDKDNAWIMNLSFEQCVKGIVIFYDGGMDQFLADHNFSRCDFALAAWSEVET